jgi:mannosyltransferase OCH1-like enzyme
MKKNVFQIWIQFRGRPEGIPVKYANQIQLLKSQFEAVGWTHKLYTDADVPSIVDKLPELWRRAFKAASCRQVVQTDLLRLFVLQKYGGLYLDADIECIDPDALNTLDFSVKGVKTRFCRDKSWGISNFIIYSEGNDPQLQGFIDSCCKRVLGMRFLLARNVQLLFGPAVMASAGPWAILATYWNKGSSIKQSEYGPIFHHFGDTTWINKKKIILTILATCLIAHLALKNKKEKEKPLVDRILER